MITIRESKMELGFLGRITGHVDINKAIELVKDNEVDTRVDPNLSWLNYHKVQYNYENYIVVNEGRDTVIYKSIPLVKNDSVFTWERKNASLLECIIKAGHLRFKIEYNCKSNTATIAVFYWIPGQRKGVNQLIGHINISDYADNERISSAINDYLTKYKSESEKIKLL